MPAIKKMPQRKCIGCGISKNKKDLIRVVRSPENDISIDLKGKKSGRGAYICKDENCLKKAVKAKRFEKNLEVEISPEILEALLQQLKSEPEQETNNKKE
jgi:predicted RNA-binding protein YlxR (DUF448 family)